MAFPAIPTSENLRISFGAPVFLWYPQGLVLGAPAYFFPSKVG